MKKLFKLTLVSLITISLVACASNDTANKNGMTSKWLDLKKCIVIFIFFRLIKEKEC